MSVRNVRIAVMSLMALVTGVALCEVPTAHADFYKYTDRSGAVCITNSPNSVPPQYRSP